MLENARGEHQLTLDARIGVSKLLSRSIMHFAASFSREAECLWSFESFYGAFSDGQSIADSNEASCMSSHVAGLTCRLGQSVADVAARNSQLLGAANATALSSLP